MTDYVPTKKGVDAVIAIADILLEAIKAGGDHGAPGGTLYSAVMGVGIQLHQFEFLMKLLIDSGRVVKRGQHYYATGVKSK